MSANLVNSEQKNVDAVPASHRVVVFGVPDDPEPLEQILADSSGIDRASARLWASSLPGIIPYTLNQSTAAGIAADIRRLGLNAASIPSSEVPDLSHARQTHHVRINDDLFGAVDIKDHSESWPWSAVAVLSVGVVPTTAPATHRSAPTLAGGSSHRSWNDGVNVPPRHRPEAFVVLAGNRSVLSFASDEMNYEYLAGRLNPSSSANFRQLIKDLATQAVGAWVTPSTRSFLDRSPVRHYEFRSHDDFRRYTEFQTLLSGQFGNASQ